MARKPSENPYHHPFVKPLAFDCDLIERMCRECFEIAMATQAIGAFWNDDLSDFGEESDWSFPLLVARHQETAEERISAILLSLSASYRALDDQLSGNSDFEKFKEDQLDLHTEFLTVYTGGKIPATVRECCNKIIHTEDFRPVYDNNSEPRDKGVYHMTGSVELFGRRGKVEWELSFDLFTFLEAMLETVDFLRMGKANRKSSTVEVPIGG